MAKSDEAGGSETSQGNTIEQVRDLLFGAEAKSQRDELSNLRKQLERSLQKLETTLTERIDTLADRQRADVRSLTEAAATESGERADAEAAIHDQIMLTKTSLAELADATSTEARAQDNRLAAAQAELAAAIDSARTELSSRLDAARADLDDRKADRKAIAGLLHSMANALAPPDPGPEAETKADAQGAASKPRRTRSKD